MDDAGTFLRPCGVPRGHLRHCEVQRVTGCRGIRMTPALEVYEEIEGAHCLTRSEWALYEVLHKAMPNVARHSALCRAIGQYSDYLTQVQVRVYIKRLRDKLGE